MVVAVDGVGVASLADAHPVSEVGATTFDVEEAVESEDSGRDRYAIKSLPVETMFTTLHPCVESVDS